MLGFIVMGILAALDSAMNQGGSTTPPAPSIGIQPLSSPVTVQLGGPGTSQSLQGTQFTYTSTPAQTLAAVNQAAATVLNSPNNQTAIIQSAVPGISRYIVMSQSAAQQAGIQGATSGTVGIQAAGSKSIRYNL